ncbi:hypothetical protein DOTSEDRAFT_160582 [Dothistroma septosporum NZE10]|uniref:Major facilitator superfamily (MFS) profile domain-containing protein n=2 Tax=Dothistroma septosporum TaxID=64363 RepID=M2WIS9_DOTSN|nr:putative MFS multidrug transporter [Dothistroma septosporum]EME38868.1 hypothetical protein DOTSEDRAFT_160582 [Dothistroma septosporum NZE10]
MNSTNSSAEVLKSTNDESSLARYGVHLEGNEVHWNDDASDHPRNWRPSTKYYSAIVISWLELYMTGISSAGVSAADTAREEYHMSRTLAYFAFVSIYLLGQTVGGIFLAPISETFGRRTIYIIATSMFCVFSVITAAVPSVAGVYVGRWFQGIAAAIPATVAFGNFQDMFDARMRIGGVFGYTMSGFIGLSMGPVYAAYITERCGWRWVFYISAIASAISVVLSYGVKESDAGQLLQAKVKAISEETGRTDLTAGAGSSQDFSIKTFARNDLLRPLIFLTTEPIVLFCAILCAIAFGLLYGLTAGLTVAYTDPPFSNTFNEVSSSLSFIAILIGILLDVIPRFYDDHLYRKCHKNNIRIVPETKIRSFALACPLFAIGLWIFAWTVPPKVTTVPWPVSMIGLICIGFATTDFSYVLFGYVTDSYGEYAASAVSALSTTRTIAAAVFPLFAYQMFSGLGTNIAATILAAVATLFAFTPILFLKYGHALRHKSKTAGNDEDCLEEENSHLELDEKCTDSEGTATDDAV